MLANVCSLPTAETINSQGTYSSYVITQPFLGFEAALVRRCLPHQQLRSRLKSQTSSCAAQPKQSSGSARSYICLLFIWHCIRVSSGHILSLQKDPALIYFCFQVATGIQAAVSFLVTFSTKEVTFLFLTMGRFQHSYFGS